MRQLAIILLATLGLAAGAVAAAPPSPTAPKSLTAEEDRALAVRIAQVEGYHRLADMILATTLPDGKTLGAVLGPGSDKEIALRLLLRSACVAGDPRVYSDGVTEVNVEIPVDAVAAKVLQLLDSANPSALDGLREQAFDGYLRTGGRGVAPPDVLPERARKVAAMRPEEFAEMYPIGWQRVTAEGRVEAESRARTPGLCGDGRNGAGRPCGVRRHRRRHGQRFAGG